jgi:hypothetical protein
MQDVGPSSSVAVPRKEQVEADESLFQSSDISKLFLISIRHPEGPCAFCVKQYCDKIFKGKTDHALIFTQH